MFDSLTLGGILLHFWLFVLICYKHKILSSASCLKSRGAAPLLEMASASDEETHAWLRAHGAELPVDMRPESVAFLRRLAAASTHRDRTERQLALDAERRCAMHAAELEKLEDVLQQCGIAPKSLPTSITGSLGVQPPHAQLCLGVCGVCWVLAGHRLVFCELLYLDTADHMGATQKICPLQQLRWALETQLLAACMAPSTLSRFVAVCSQLLFLPLPPSNLRLPPRAECTAGNALTWEGMAGCWIVQVEEAETRGAIGSEEQLCSSLHSRLAECNSLLQNLRDIELACKEQAQREAREQAGRKQDMTTLEKKSIQYKQVFPASKTPPPTNLPSSLERLPQWLPFDAIPTRPFSRKSLTDSLSTCP